MMWSHFVTAASLVAVLYGSDTPINVNICEHMEVTQCQTMQTGSYYTTLYATGPGSDICRVVSREDRLHMDQYVYTVELYNQAGWKGIHSGYFGVAYNVIDVNNFDFVYFRPHLANSQRCIQHGYYKSGKPYYASQTLCKNSSVRGGTWFKVTVKASRGGARVFINGICQGHSDNHFPTRGQTGVMVYNGYRNVIRYRNAQLAQL